MVDVLFIALPDTLLLDLAGPAEAFRIANQALGHSGQAPAFRLRFAGPEPDAATSVGLRLTALEPLPVALTAPTWVVLSGRPGNAQQVLGRSRPWTAVRQWLTQVVHPALAEGSSSPHRLMTVCVGALLAADAGLLHGRHCTTHHQHLDELQQLAPGAQVQANRLWVEDGALMTSAGVTAGIDMALHCIARHCGDALAAHVAQVLVAAGRRSSEAPQRSPLLAYREHLHPGLHRVQDAVASQPARDWSVEALAELACVTTRHLTRLFRQHTGLSPRSYVEHVRVALARQALARGANVRQAAELAGFASDRQWRRARQRAEQGEAATALAEAEADAAD